MAATAPLLKPHSPDFPEDSPGPFEQNPGPNPVPGKPIDPDHIMRGIEHQNLLLAQEAVAPDEIRYFVDDLADQILGITGEALTESDPYFMLATQRALLGCFRAFDTDDAASARNQLRIRLDQLRQVCRDLAEGGTIYEDRPADDVVRWIDQTLDVPQARLAELLGVSARTFQRWVSETDPSAPEGEDARRVRTIAHAANHLRHALTGPGVVRWFEAPNAQLEDRPPAELLDDPEGAPRLATLAASTRSHTAA